MPKPPDPHPALAAFVRMARLLAAEARQSGHETQAEEAAQNAEGR